MKGETIRYVEVRDDGTFWKAQGVTAHSDGLSLDEPKEWIKSDTVAPVRR